MQYNNIVLAIVVGLLLPALLSRPDFLDKHPMKEHVRLRWGFLYTIFSFAGASYVYVTAVILLKPTSGFSLPAEHAIAGAATLLLLLFCARHIPPLLLPRRGWITTCVQIVGALTCGIFAGGFLAVDELNSASFSAAPTISYISWMGVFLSGYALCAWYSPIPSERLAAFRLRRAIKHHRYTKKAT